jgi:hypothetical protein
MQDRYSTVPINQTLYTVRAKPKKEASLPSILLSLAFNLDSSTKLSYSQKQRVIKEMSSILAEQ